MGDPLSIHPSNQTKPAMAPRVFFQGLEELRLAEIWPKRRGDDEFGVGNLPQKEIADAHFAAGPNQQIRIGIRRSVKML